MSFRSMVTAAIVVLSLGSAPALAQQQAPGKTGGGVLGLLPADAVTEHVLNAGGQAIHYEATAGTLDLFGDIALQSVAAGRAMLAAGGQERRKT